MNNIIDKHHIEGKLSFIELSIINQPQGSVFSDRINEKKYFNIQTNIKNLVKNKPKKILSRVKIYNNYKEVNIGTRYYYYNMSVVNYTINRMKKINYLMKTVDNKVLDPVDFPDIIKYNNSYNESVYRYRYMPDNRVINSIDIYFSSIKERDKK